LFLILIIQIGGDQEEERRIFEGVNNILCSSSMTCPLHRLDGGLDAIIDADNKGNDIYDMYDLSRDTVVSRDV